MAHAKKRKVTKFKKDKKEKKNKDHAHVQGEGKRKNVCPRCSRQTKRSKGGGRYCVGGCGWSDKEER